ncbi:hypothetical protein [Rhizobium sp. BK377]|uniref:hypothetical protein n=1 Tax=Rhizobium sp. BK377 TaxID=2587058 RepID=UPI001614812D|nr:hypothetical protein [Rhizobium sp. BK377]MBB3464543.1 hypothetical protein [Rhizobium sp. BK377]
MANSTIRLKAFYSWQSDSPKKTNLNAIRDALKSACEAISAASPSIKVERDEATRNVPGSPNIAGKIMEKIEACDIFIADITTITPRQSSRPCPNPNVTHELGFAVAHLGWDRVILLFNTAHGVFPGDMPFDFAQHRAHPYSFSETGGAAERKALADFLKTAVDMIIAGDPKRPAQLKGLTKEKIQHDHDVRNITWLMSNIHLPTMDDYIDELPYKTTFKAAWFSDRFTAIVTNSLFYVYDPAIRKAIGKLSSGWRRAMSHDDRYHHTANYEVQVFSNPMDAPLRKEQQDDWDDIDKARRKMRRALDELIERIRKAYFEVDLHHTNEKAWAAWRKFQSDEDEVALDLTVSVGKKKRKAS